MPLSALQRLFSFTAFQQGQGTSDFPGTQLDTDLDQTNNALNAVVAQLAALVRADGKLANGSVTRNALAADVRLGLGASRPWVTGNAYAASDTVTQGYGLYQCLIAHMSGIFGADLAAGRWVLVADLSQAVVIAAGAIGTAALGAKAVTEPKLDDGAASTRVIGDGAVTRAKAALNLGVVPVGAEIDYAGSSTPVGWVFCAGQAVSRTAYADLFAALTTPILVQTFAGNPNVGIFAPDLRGVGVEGAVIEGPGIPPGTTVLSVNSAADITLSSAATASANGVLCRLFPYGRGDGASTFNVPDRRGLVTAGRDNMGGTAANRLNRALKGVGLASRGGADGEILTLAHIPVALPKPTGNVSYPTQTYRKSNENNVSFTPATLTADRLNVNAGGSDVQTVAPGPQALDLTLTNPTGGQPHLTVQPTGIANRIIFAGV